MNPQAILETADQFDHAAAVINDSFFEQLERQPTDGTDTVAFGMIPHVVNAALAIELYLKCLYALTLNAPVPKRHSLKLLFEELPANVQQKVRANYQRMADHQLNQWMAQQGGIASTFDSIIENASLAFENFRYHFEPGKPLLPWLAGNLAPAVRATIIELKPEWASLPAPTSLRRCC